MYPSNGNGNGNGNINNPMISCSAITHDINSNSKQQDPPPSSLFHFPSPYNISFEDDTVFLQHLHDIFLQPPHEPPFTTTTTTTTTADINSTSAMNKNVPKVDCNKRRSSKKDRHSKINTAHGPRDRRMRLSLVVARRFFDLQDMLGFDKASKTVEWLLTKSKASIKELARGLPVHMKLHSCNSTTATAATSSTSESSGILDESSITIKNPLAPRGTVVVAKEKEKRRVNRTALRKKSAFRPLARESREKARERARERTREKKSKLCGFEAMNQNHDDHLNQLGSWSIGEEESGTQSHPSFEVMMPEVEELSSPRDQGNHVGDSLVITGGNWSPSIIFNSQHNTTSQEHQSTDFQFYGKPWEAYNNINLLYH